MLTREKFGCPKPQFCIRKKEMRQTAEAACRYRPSMCTLFSEDGWDHPDQLDGKPAYAASKDVRTAEHLELWGQNRIPDHQHRRDIFDRMSWRYGLTGRIGADDQQVSRERATVVFQLGETGQLVGETIVVICGTTRLARVFFRRLITWVRCGHMFGLSARLWTAGLDEVRDASG